MGAELIDSKELIIAITHSHVDHVGGNWRFMSDDGSTLSQGVKDICVGELRHNDDDDDDDTYVVCTY